MVRAIAFILFVLISPVFFCVAAAIWIITGKPVLFAQKRIGKDKKVFTMYKFRTMLRGAEGFKKSYQYLNEAKPPVFKIRNDPRYTTIGRFLSHTGLDELPQLINIIKGEMAFVGPRPLPVEEAKKIPKKYHARFSVLPGITSPWVIKGSHAMPFSKWMELDLAYVRDKSFTYDIYISVKTIELILKSLFNKLLGK